MNTRRVVVPDLGDAVTEVVTDLTQMLIALVDETLESELPSVLADGFGLEALDRIWVLLKPTQQRTTPRLFAPEWRAEYLRLSVVELDAADLATMGEAIRALGAGLLTGGRQITGALVTSPTPLLPPRSPARHRPTSSPPSRDCTACSISRGPTTPNASTSSSTRPAPPRSSSWCVAHRTPCSRATLNPRRATACVGYLCAG
jgi:hypothetical protein